MSRLLVQLVTGWNRTTSSTFPLGVLEHPDPRCRRPDVNPHSFAAHQLARRLPKVALSETVACRDTRELMNILIDRGALSLSSSSGWASCNASRALVRTSRRSARLVSRQSRRPSPVGVPHCSSVVRDGGSQGHAGRVLQKSPRPSTCSPTTVSYT